MDKVRLGRSDLVVTRLCLGSMSWGSKNTAEEGHAQMERALDGGINFIDTAEVYPTYPVRPETVGRTEEIIGEWFARTGRRNDWVLATKVSTAPAARGGEGYSGAIIPKTVDASLKRLKTDVIDLYQLHFPMRGKAYHMRANWEHNPEKVDRAAMEEHVLDVLGGIAKMIEAGKIRHFGLSNETVWGAATWVRLAEANGLPRPVSIQNEYSLLCRHADLDMAEFCVAENIAYLPFSPLAMGLISGKYAPDTTPPDTRRAAESTLNGRINPQVWPAIDAYLGIAHRHGLDVNAMALAWTLTRHFVTSPIFGASTMEQLETALGAADLVLSDEVLAEIDQAHRAHPVPF